MTRATKTLSAIAVLALVAFTGAPFLHEVVPHTHGPNNIIWDQIHSVIGFGKGGTNFFPIYTNVYLIAFVLLLTLLVHDQKIKCAEQNKLHYALTRGKFPYRKFR